MSGVTATTVLASAAVASAAMSAYGAVKQGEAQKQMYDAQAQADQYNATVAKNNAQVANDQANQKEQLQRRQFNEVQGKAFAGVAQSGTGFGGSNADVLRQNAVNGELDALNIRYQGQLQSNGLMAQSGLDTYNAGQAVNNGNNALSAGYVSAGANLISGASNAYMANKGIGAYKTT